VNAKIRSPLVSSLLFALLVLIMAGAAFGAGYLFHAHQSPSAEFPLLGEAYQIVQNHGIKELPASPAMQYGMIRGMLQAYEDPFTVFVEPVQHELESNALQGSFGGIGVELSSDAEGYVVLFPFPSGPAIEAGVQDGDRLLQVDDTPITPGMPVSDVQSAIRGPVGETIDLLIARPPDYQNHIIKIKRAEVALPTVTRRLDLNDPSVGILNINLIAATTTAELQDAVRDLQSKGASFFVLDLRDNPGGLLDAGVDVARLFLTEGEIITRQYRGQEAETYTVDKPGPLAELPLVVVVNHGSASAAEIIAGALQARGRARLVGAPTFGKDTIQLVFTLSDQSSLHITAAQWWVPGLQYEISANGLQPDIQVEPPTNADAGDTALQAAVQAVLEPAP